MSRIKLFHGRLTIVQPAFMKNHCVSWELRLICWFTHMQPPGYTVLSVCVCMIRIEFYYTLQVILEMQIWQTSCIQDDRLERGKSLMKTREDSQG